MIIRVNRGTYGDVLEIPIYGDVGTVSVDGRCITVRQARGLARRLHKALLQAADQAYANKLRVDRRSKRM